MTRKEMTRKEKLITKKKTNMTRTFILGNQESVSVLFAIQLSPEHQNNVH